MEPQEKIRVLLVDDIPEVRENLRKLLYFERDIEVAGIATNGEESISMARQLRPDIVLMDINMPGMDGITASEHVGREVPSTQIIMMSVQGETDYLRRSMLAGAKGFLIKPFGSDELITTIRSVYNLRPKVISTPVASVAGASGVAPVVPTAQAPAQRREAANIIAVFSPKGGVGCSTLATNLAIALRTLHEDKVVLVDCDLQFGDVGVLLNLQANHTMAELAGKQGHIDSDLLDVILTPHISGIKVLLAPTSPEEADLLTTDLIKETLGVLRGMFTYVIVDMASAVQDLALNVFDLATRILLVTTPDIPSIKNTKLFFEVVEALGYPEDKIKLVLNKADRASPIGAQEIASSLKHPVFPVPSDKRAADVATNQGIPCIMGNRSGPIALSIMRMAELLTQELAPAPQAKEEPPKAQREPAGILSRLLGR